MAGAFPISTAKFGTLGIKSIQTTIVSKSVNGKKLARQIDSQRFGFTVQIITAKRSDVYGELMAFIIKQRSGKENFTIIPPEIEDARGTASGTPHGTASAGATSITLGGTGTGTLKAGDFIKFANHDKVYMVVADQSDISTGSLTIEPPLRTAVANSNITYDNVPFTVYLTNDIQDFGVSGADNSGNLYYEYQFDVEEAL
ncbi:MAG TPA: hypothetical protein VLB82_08110 [Thermodesulfobacteriota bacterium]|jgi:hypothetical protein|nr:hypothetical protein [Thermodesulfobacteriota bacterium]